MPLSGAKGTLDKALRSSEIERLPERNTSREQLLFVIHSETHLAQCPVTFNIKCTFENGYLIDNFYVNIDVI